MVTTAFVNIWGLRVGAIAWDDNTGLGSFEYDEKTIFRYKTGQKYSPISHPS